MRKFAYLIPALLILCFSCSNPWKKEQPSAQKKVLRLNFTRKPPTLDPRKTGDIVSSTLQFMLGDGLTRMTKKSTRELGLCDYYTISSDGITYTFHLRKAYWSDGTQVSASDFERTFKEMLSPSFPSPSVNLLYYIKGAEKAKKGLIPLSETGIRAINAKMLEITLERPTPFFLDITSFCCLFPVHNDGVIEDNVISCGPFMIKEYKPDSELILQKNPFYWDRDHVMLDEIHISFVSSDATAYQMFENDEIDIMGLTFSTIPADSVPTLKSKSRIRSQSVGATSFVQFHTTSFPFSNKNMRKAVANSINRKDIIDHILQMNEEVAYSIIPTMLEGNSEKKYYQDGSPTLAQQYLDKALEEMDVTLDDINPISYYYLQTERNARVVQAIASQMRTIGLEIKPVALEYNVLLDKLRRRDFQMSQSAWIVQYNDSMNILERFKDRSQPTNDPNWENDEYRLLVDLSFYESDPATRSRIVQAAEDILMEELPQVPLYHWKSSYLLNPKVKNLYISPIGSVHLTHIDLVEEGSDQT